MATFLRAVVIYVLISGSCSPVLGTWSIIIIDTETREIGVGAATCLLNFDLRRALPVIRVETGAGCAQAMVDNGTNRLRIWNGLINGLTPEQILAQLQQSDVNHQRRQYGIADVLGRRLTFTGNQTLEYSDGVIGAFDHYVYAIQGNILTGAPVIDVAEAALLNAPGGLPDKLMAAMEGARSMGGDGRCSCSPNDPMGCGSPPEEFYKSAHVGFVIVSRRGDVDGVCNGAVGCASGTYFMNFNYVTNVPGAPDPVFKLQEMFDAFRQATVGVPDQVESIVTVTPTAIPNDGRAAATLRIEVRDWTGAPAVGIEAVTVAHDAGSAGSCQIGAVSDLGGSVFEAPLTAGTNSGCDRFAVTVKAGAFERVLIPAARLWVFDRQADLDGDGQVGESDLGVLLAAYGLNGNGDLDGDGDTDQSDLGHWLALLMQRCP